MGRDGTRPAQVRVRNASGFGAAISSRKRSNDHGHAAGMPRSSRYQLRQPVTQTVCFAASIARRLELVHRVVRRADLAALAGRGAAR